MYFQFRNDEGLDALAECRDEPSEGSHMSHVSLDRKLVDSVLD